MFLNNQLVTEEIEREIKEMSRNKWQWKWHLKPMGCIKSSSKREVYSSTILPQETRKTSTRQPNFIPKTTGKRRRTTTKNPQISRRKEIMKIQAETNEKEMKETIVKINKTKSWFFEKIKLTTIEPDSSTKKERRIKSTKLEIKKERLQQTMQKYKGL